MILLLKLFSKTIKFIRHSASHRNSAVCLPFIVGNIFLPLADDQMFSIVVSKCRMSREFCCLFTGI